MAAARDSDIALWLYNKLGTSSDTWSEASICSQLNVEALRNIKECFMELPTQIKLKLMLSFFHIAKRNAEEWRNELEEIMEVAVMDSDPWVAMIAEIMKTFPGSGALNIDFREPREQGDSQRIVHDLTAELRKIVKRYSDIGLLPMECSYLNRNVLLAAAPQQPNLPKHFNLKRKPKAAALRAELVMKSADAQATVKKSQLPTVPMRSRGLPRNADAMPMRGIPRNMSAAGLLRTTSQHNTSLGSANRPRPLPLTARRKDGGIKLLDIKDSPIATQQARKRRKIQEAAEAKAAEALETKPSRKLTAQQQESAGQQHILPDTGVDVPEQSAVVVAAVDGNVVTQPDDLQNDQHQLTPLEPVAVSTLPADVAGMTTEVSTPDYAAGLTPATPGGPAAPQATPILAAASTGAAVAATATALHVGGSVQLPAGTIISRQSIQQQPPAGATLTRVSTAQSNVVTIPSLGQRILLAQAPGGQEQKIIIANAPGSGEQRIILAAPNVSTPQSGSEQRILLTAPAGGAGEQRIILNTPAGTAGEQRLLLAAPGAAGEQRFLITTGPNGEQRLILAPAAPAEGEQQQRIIVAGGDGQQRIMLPQGATLLQQGHTLVYRTIAPQQQQPQQQGYAEQQQDTQQPQYATLQPVQPDLLYTVGSAGADATTAQHQQQVIGVQQTQHQNVTVLQPAAVATSNAPSTQPLQQQQVQVVPAAGSSPQGQKRSLSLTREQMLEAQEMFRTSNKVTRPEKALILGFMAGSRENPCPHLGNIVTIKLSEGEETVSQPGGSFITMLAETHFQMNYNTGEWRRIKKYKTLPVEQQSAA